MMTETSAGNFWEAVKRRDAAAEHPFVYAVVTTGVYCRPSCPARRPRIENVRFFGSNAEAEQAGFRACKRCKPDMPDLEARNAEAVAKAAKLIAEGDGAPDFDAIARKANMSRHHFHRTFSRIMGMTPGAYLKSLRERRVVDELSSGSTVTEAIYGAGYSSSSRFYETVAPRLGLKPRSFTKGGEGGTILFAIGETSLGSVLVAATEKGLCTIKFGDNPQALVQEMQDKFPNAEFAGGDSDFERIVAGVVGMIDRPGGELALPLHVRGTAFQHQVWRALCDIPFGKTMTYAGVAAKIGKPGAVRAVANACASNHHAVAIPCHRVVRTGGSLSGYRWGVERKAALLAKEAAA